MSPSDTLCGCGYRQSLHRVDAGDGGIYCQIAALRHQLAAEGLIASPASQQLVVKSAYIEGFNTARETDGESAFEAWLHSAAKIDTEAAEVSSPATASHSVGSLLHLEGEAVECQESLSSPASQSVKQASQHVAELVLKLGDTKRGEELLAAINALRDADREVSSPARPQLDIVDKTKVGLYRKFSVHRTDGSDRPGGKHDDCSYYVLDLTHDKHAIPALKAYAKSCRKEFPLLAKDLDAIVDGNRLMPYRTHMPAPEGAVSAAPPAHLVIEKIEPPKLRYGQPDSEAFEQWWAREGMFIDPDTSDVSWFDKRKELCGLAFVAAMAQSGNYTANSAVEPTEVTFSNGRRVKVSVSAAPPAMEQKQEK